MVNFGGACRTSGAERAAIAKQHTKAESNTGIFMCEVIETDLSACIFKHSECHSATDFVVPSALLRIMPHAVVVHLHGTGAGELIVKRAVLHTPHHARHIMGTKRIGPFAHSAAAAHSQLQQLQHSTPGVVSNCNTIARDAAGHCRQDTPTPERMRRWYHCKSRAAPLYSWQCGAGLRSNFVPAMLRRSCCTRRFTMTSGLTCA